MNIAEIMLDDNQSIIFVFLSVHNNPSFCWVFVCLQYPYLEAQGNLPDILKKALISFDEVIYIFII
jgi:hypothetical protein